MRIKHRLKIYNSASEKLSFIKIIKEFTGCRLNGEIQGLKAAKYIADLSKGSGYFDENNEHYENKTDDPVNIDSHIEWLEKNSIFDDLIVTNDYLSITFDMDVNSTELFKKSLNELGVDFVLDGLSELRDEKIRDLLS